MWRSKVVVAGSLLALVVLTGCHRNRLRDFEYSDRSVSVVSDLPRRPEVLSGPLFLHRTGDPIRDIVRAGTTIVREIQAADVQRRLDEAARNVDIDLILEQEALERAARYLGARPVEAVGDEDYVLELVVEEYGIDAEGWEATAYFYIKAEAALLERRSGTEIWRRGVDASDPIGPEIWGPARGIRNVVTAAVLADLSVEEIESALESLADYSARVITDRLRDDLRKAREGEQP